MKKWLLFVIMFLSGFWGLIYESVFLLLSVIIVGANAAANAFVLALFLLGLALGALCGGMFVRRNSFCKRILVINILAGSVLALVGIFIFPGVYARFSSAVYLSCGTLIVLAVSFFNGIGIPLVVRMLEKEKYLHPAGVVYFANTLGAVLGAVMSGLVIIPAWGFSGAVMFAAALGFLACLLTVLMDSWKIKKAAILFCLWCLLLLFLKNFVFDAGGDLSFLQRIYLKKIALEQPVRPIVSVMSRYQHILVGESPYFGRQLYLDGRIQVSESDSDKYHEFLVLPAVAAHPDPKSILVIGEGDGGGLYQVLKYPFEQIEHVELDKQVQEVSLKYLRGIHKGALDAPRISRHIMDGRQFLKNSEKKYDIVIVALPDPFALNLSALFSREFYQMVYRVLASDGVMAVQTGDVDDVSGDGRFFKAQACILKTVNSVFSSAYIYRIRIPSFLGHNSFILAAKTDDPRVVRNSLPVKGNWYDPIAHSSLFEQTEGLQSQLEKAVVPLNRDTNPVLHLFM